MDSAKNRYLGLISLFQLNFKILHAPYKTSQMYQCISYQAEFLQTDITHVTDYYMVKQSDTKLIAKTFDTF